MRRAIVRVITGLGTMLIVTACGSMSRLALEPLVEEPYEDRLLVAVVDFQNRSGEVEYDGMMESVTEAFLGDLNGTAQFRIIERERLVALVEEMELSASGLTDPSTVREVGQVLGVEALVFGNMSAITYSRNRQSIFIAYTEGEKTEVTLDARLVRTETGEILATARSTASVSQRNWVAFGFARLGRKMDQRSIIQTALQRASQQLANSVAVEKP